jgi:hypothetical protein
MRSQRMRVLSAKVIANKALRAFEGDEILLKFGPNTERQPLKPPRVQFFFLSPFPAFIPAAAAN